LGESGQKKCKSQIVAYSVIFIADIKYSFYA